ADVAGEGQERRPDGWKRLGQGCAGRHVASAVVTRGGPGGILDHAGRPSRASGFRGPGRCSAKRLRSRTPLLEKKIRLQDGTLRAQYSRPTAENELRPKGSVLQADCLLNTRLQ